MKIAWIFALGALGGLGALSRYGIGLWLNPSPLGAGFPWGTFAINLSGAFLAGLIFTLVSHRALISAELGLILVTGFLGGFTTFSALALETASLWATGQVGAGLMYLGLSSSLGLGLAGLGIWLGRMI